MLHPRLRGVLAALLALAQLGGAAGWAAEARAPAAMRPALWRLRDRDTTIWLFGTIHALPPHIEWETPALRFVIAHADRLVLEAVIDRDGKASAEALYRLGRADRPLPPLADRVPPRRRAALKAMVAKSGWPAGTLDGFKTWAAAMVLFGVNVQGLGVSSADGVEEQLKAQFASAGKPIEGLETLDQQLGFFDTMTEAQQREFLVGVLSDDGRDAADFGRMLTAWSHGNERGIQQSFDQDMKANDALATVLLARRNKRWAQLLLDRLRRPGTQFVAVGAGHLVGAQSVLADLRKRGLHPVRVQ
ncbi:TraB/GumN family protein [Sphingomonas sp.]|uniref:TraB/GumN family protein n=1 Tax=Sphingomonas sp. TaxID=28214 RepID=UPI003B001FAE